jgi:hypothetical protein
MKMKLLEIDFYKVKIINQWGDKNKKDFIEIKEMEISINLKDFIQKVKKVKMKKIQ